MWRRINSACLLILAASSVVVAQRTKDDDRVSETQSVVSQDVRTIDGILSALYETLGGPAGEIRDWKNAALGVPKRQLLAAAKATLGLHRFIVLPNYEQLGVHHIDCLVKLLDEERILVIRPPPDHPQHEYAEKAVQVLASHRSASGRPYQVLRIDTPRYRGDELASYVNALILNRKVFVPLFGIEADDDALAVWREVMSGYEVRGFESAGESAWTHTDAIHCRIKAIWNSRPSVETRSDS